MASKYLHEHRNFGDLLRIIADETNILPGLVEKDYWIMHVLNGLQKQGFNFELKGGTSLSKGFKIINRFSEDIDIHITPPSDFKVDENPSQTRRKSVESRREFYDWLAEEIKIDGIQKCTRDTAFDDERYYRSGGIRLLYESRFPAVDGVKEGILLEAGFDTVKPNQSCSISSWAFDRAAGTGIEMIDNRAVNVLCYHPGYTFVEKLQTIVTKYRQEQEGGDKKPNYMRQYYDISCLLENDKVKEFIGTEEYILHKKNRFPKKDLDIPVKENEAFLLSSIELREEFKERFTKTANLYYKGQPSFEEILKTISNFLPKL